MNIELKFKVNDLIQHKYNKQKMGVLQAYEVLQIQTETCYAGTQVFYMCRAIILNIEKDYTKDGTKKYWSLAHAINSNHSQMAWDKFREDELVAASDKFAITLSDVLGGDLEVKEDTDGIDSM